MNSRALTLAILHTSMLAAAACGTITDVDNPPSHECANEYNSDWGSVANLVLDHYQPEECPVPLQANMVAAATVDEVDATFPDDGRSERLYVTACNSYYISTFTCAGVLAADNEFFDYVDTGFEYVWRAQSAVGFEPGPNPDWLEIEVECAIFSPCDGDEPKGVVEISYEGGVEAPHITGTQ